MTSPTPSPLPVRLEATALHWLDGIDPAEDPCAHSPVHLSVGDTVLVGPEDGDCTVSAAALRLLHATLTGWESRPRQTGQLFPCCGCDVHASGDGAPVEVIDCAFGVHLAVVHADGQTHLSRRGRVPVSVPWTAWAAAVLAFTASVRGLYAAGAPKVHIEPLQEDGYEAFWLEWAALEGAIRDRLATEGQAGIGPSEES